MFRKLSPPIAPLAVAALCLIAIPSVALDRLEVTVDHAQIAKLPTGTATVVVGNPLVADASIQQSGVMVVTGRSYGHTNILVLDAQGKTLSDIGVDVTPSEQGIVTVYRGAGRETYSCAPLCETTLRVGDRPEYFDAVAGAISKRTGMSKGQGE